MSGMSNNSRIELVWVAVIVLAAGAIINVQRVRLRLEHAEARILKLEGRLSSK